MPKWSLALLVLLTGCRQVEYRWVQLTELAWETGWVFWVVLAVAIVGLASGIASTALASRRLAWVPLALALTCVLLGLAGWQLGRHQTDEAVTAMASVTPEELAAAFDDDDDRFVSLVLEPGEDSIPRPPPPLPDPEEMRQVGYAMASKSVGVGIAGAVPCLVVGVVALARRRRG